MLLAVLIHSEWLCGSILPSAIVVDAYLYIVLAFAGLPVFMDVAVFISTKVLNTNDNNNTLLVNL